MNTLNIFFEQYTAGINAAAGYLDNSCGDWGYTCPKCGQWVYMNNWHYCYPSSYYSTWSQTQENKTEKAFRILKVLVEIKIIPEPSTFKDFCDLIEKIAAVI